MDNLSLQTSIRDIEILLAHHNSQAWFHLESQSETPNWILLIQFLKASFRTTPHDLLSARQLAYAEQKAYTLYEGANVRVKCYSSFMQISSEFPEFVYR